MEGDGFRNLAQKLVTLGAKYGDIQLGDLLPCARTVSRHLTTVATAERKALTDTLSTQWRLAVTSDLWTHESTNLPYITVTVHYISSAWELCAHILATREMEEKKTAKNIRDVIESILDEFQANRVSNAFITDNGANIKAAFADQLWISCTGHNLNLAVSHALDSKHMEDGPLAALRSHSAITDLVGACKDIVTRVKRTQIQSMLETTLKQV